ncbi:hypothetical protein [Sphingomonas sp.]|uniref:hypothetical protein n=1 Tax=Sphingomonas sp. TaxID=28214 RepID=UPI003B3B7430
MTEPTTAEATAAIDGAPMNADRRAAMPGEPMTLGFDLASPASDGAAIDVVAPPHSFALDHAIADASGKVLYPAGTRIMLRRFNAGEMRGLTMLAVSQLDYAALEQLLPRITTPPLYRQAVQYMDPADLMQAGNEVMDFLLPSAAKAGSPPA